MAEPKSVFHMPRYKRVEFEEEDSGRINYSPDAIGFGNPNATSVQIVSPPSSSVCLDAGSDNLSIPDRAMATSDSSELVGSNRIVYSPSSERIVSTITSGSGGSMVGGGVGSGGPKFTVRKAVIINKGRVQIRTFWDRASPMEKFWSISFVFAIICSIILLVLFFHYMTQHVKNYRKVDICLTKDCVSMASTILNSLNEKVDPCDDFYSYACGGWLEQNPLPDGHTVWGPFVKLTQDNQYVLKNVLERTDSNNQSGAEEMSRVYYQSCLDKNKTIEKLGAKPMIEFLDKIGGWNISGNFSVTEWSLQETLQTVHNKYNRLEPALFSWMVDTDAKNSSNNIIQLDQGGLTLPSRDYYLNKTSDDKVLDALRTFMVKVGVLLGGKEDDVQRQVKDMIELETRLAEITIPVDNRTDQEEIYKRFELRKLQEICPSIDWRRYFASAFDKINYTITDDELVAVYAVEYFTSLSNLIEEYNKTDEKRIVLANYIGWSVVESLISSLSKNFRDAEKLLRKALEGTETSESAWRYCVEDTNRVMGFALGAMFVKEVFKGESKSSAEEMIEQIRAAFEQNLANIKWMDEETRKLAKEKADAISEMIGFPDFILNSSKLDERYEGLEFLEDAYFENNVRKFVAARQKNIERITKPTNKTEWDMTPSTVNAYYTPTKDAMVIPAGILQKPFYDVNYPKSVNFGAMGVVMGHELTHAFDNNGRKYDKHGNLREWWDNHTISKFEEQIKCFVEQYSSYKIGEDKVSGERTLGENLADNGGLKAAYHAYRAWSHNNSPEPTLPGVNLTSTQIFFVRFAQVWCNVITPEALKLRIQTDSHCPNWVRVIGTLSNSRDFAQAFNCPENSKMNPPKKCEVW